LDIYLEREYKSQKTYKFKKADKYDKHHEMQKNNVTFVPCE